MKHYSINLSSPLNCLETHEVLLPVRRVQLSDTNLVSLKVVRRQSLVKRQGRRPMAWEFVFTVNDMDYTVTFGNKDNAMVYACSLLRYKGGSKFYRDELESHDCDPWIRELFLTIFPSRDRDFDEWHRTFISDRQRLSQAKSQASAQIKSAMNSAPEGAVEQCILNAQKDKFRKSTSYIINVPPERITLPAEWLRIINYDSRSTLHE